MNKDKYLLNSLDSIIADRFGRYSKYIIQQRALPDARDGLKPVQRRILYSMWELNLKFDKSYKKSARVVGDVIGKYHPHGDSSIYEAMVRMAQEWKMGIPLIDMHGNKGSVDDDPAAAMRYTEARLEKISSLMLQGIEKKNVSFAPNFDDSEIEPTVLPSLLPNLLLNGARGIASGFATEIPPHNLGEILDAAIAKIKNSEVSLNKLKQYIKGPDFPTGGIIYGTEGINKAFETGNGRITLTCKYKIVEQGKKKFIEIFEIPFGVIKSKLVKDIDNIAYDEAVPGIKEVLDQSNREGILIVIELEHDANIEVIMNYLFQKTELQIYYSYNVVAIENLAPKLMNLNNLLDSYLNHIKDFKIKEIKYDLLKNQEKLEIVEGFIKVSEITDEVIKIIKDSDNSKKGVIENLQKTFGFTNLQATSIAELKLYRLSRIDQIQYQEEKKSLEEKISFWKNLLEDEQKFNQYLIGILLNIKKEFVLPRKTEIKEQELKIQINSESLIKSESLYIGVTRDGYIKRISTKTFDSNEISNYLLKEGDKLVYLHKVNTVNKLLVFNSKGGYALININKIPEEKWKKIGVHINQFAEMPNNAKIIAAFNIIDFQAYAFINLITSNGYGKKVLIADFETSRNNKFMTAIKLKDNGELIGAKLSNNQNMIVIVNSEGKAVKFKENEIPIYSPKSSGVKIMTLQSKVFVENFVIAKEKDTVFLSTPIAKMKKMHFNDIGLSSKGNIGKQLFIQNKSHPIFVEVFEKVEFNDQIWMFDKENNISTFNIKEIGYTKNIDGFSKTKGNNIIMTSFNNDNNVSLENFPYIENQNLEEIQAENIQEQKTLDLESSIEEKIQLVDEIDIDNLLKKVLKNDK